MLCAEKLQTKYEKSESLVENLRLELGETQEKLHEKLNPRDEAGAREVIVRAAAKDTIADRIVELEEALKANEKEVYAKEKELADKIRARMGWSRRSNTYWTDYVDQHVKRDGDGKKVTCCAAQLSVPTCQQRAIWLNYA